ncbi:MAG TPA: hypothetical protein VEC57_14505 [Candidatus Limnocylindrales bacterium]|nr:hypothetical protein [Candidatus Limnocylindrales bacterium]
MALLISRAAAASGANVETVEQPDWPVYLWPECVPAWRAFLDLQDQWGDHGMARSEILAHLRETVHDADERRDVYDGVVACARAARAVVLAARVERMRKRAEEAEAARRRR